MRPNDKKHRVRLIFLSAVVSLMLVACGDEPDSKKQALALEALALEALALCETLKLFYIISECAPDAQKRTIEIRVDTNSREATEMCTITSNAVAKASSLKTLKGKWQVQIFSPFSGEHPLAVCRL